MPQFISHSGEKLGVSLNVEGGLLYRRLVRKGGRLEQRRLWRPQKDPIYALWPKKEENNSRSKAQKVFSVKS